MEQKQKLLGVIGGLGPIATAYFMELVVKMTEADCDQQHMDMIVYNCPSIPDRTSFIVGRSKESPLPRMIEIGCALAAQGAEAIAIPCITAHSFHEALSAEIPVPIINIVEETAVHLQQNGIKRVGVMATDGTVQSRLFQKYLDACGIQTVLPDVPGQQAVMDLIYHNVKANCAVDIEKFYAVGSRLKEQGAEAVVLGCTELSLIKRDYPIGKGYIDAMEVLARASILRMDRPLKKTCQCLITK